MKIIDRVLSKLGYSRESGVLSALRAAYVAANNNRHREKHWGDVTSTDADSDMASCQKIIRERSRFEMRNNSYARGVSKIGANFVIGDGPRIQMKTDDEIFNEKFENDFHTWSLAADAANKMCLADMLNLGEQQLYPCGEYFLIKSNSTDKSRITDVELRYRMIEPDRIDTPDSMTSDDMVRNGVRINENGAAEIFYVLKYHPGRGISDRSHAEFSASDVIHEAIIIRPEQTRGEPILSAALPLFADFRRFSSATLGAAEAAALFAVLLETQAFDNETVAPQIFDIEPGTIGVMPPGCKTSQIKPEHPSTTFPMFKREFLSEVGAGAGMPYNVVAMDSSSHSYASGRIDWQAFHQSIIVRRNHIKVNVLSRIVGDFLDEWLRINPQADETARQAYYKFGVLWPGLPHIDPAKEANAVATQWGMGATTLEDEWAKKGYDFRPKLAQWKKEREMLGFVDQADSSADNGTNNDIDDEDKEDE